MGLLGDWGELATLFGPGGQSSYHTTSRSQPHAARCPLRLNGVKGRVTFPPLSFSADGAPEMPAQGHGFSEAARS